MSHDDRAAIREALARLSRESGLPMLFGGALTGTDRLQITEFIGAQSGTMRGLRVESGSGVGGRAMALRQPVIVNDYARADVITHHYDEAVVGEGIRTMVGVPVVVGRSVRAVLYGALRTNVTVGDRVVDSVITAARMLEQDIAVRDAFEARSPAVEAFPPADLGVDAVREQLFDLAGRADDQQVRGQLLRLVAALPTVPPLDPGIPLAARAALSSRETEVLVHVAVGCSNAEIGQRMGVGAETIKSYLRTAMRKLEVNNRIEAVVAARRAGLL